MTLFKRGQAIRLAGISCLLLVIGSSTGCNTLRPKSDLIPAVDLPVQFRSAHQSRRPPIDLSVLASRSLNSDLIYPGDVLDITLITGAEEEQPEPLPYRVNPDGTVDLPLVGAIPVTGLTLTGAEEQIRQQSIARRIYRQPIVSVLLNTRQTDRVRVVGAVDKPGDYEIPRAGSDLLAAIIAAGGLTEDAGQQIEIRHRVLNDTEIAQAGYRPGQGPPRAVEVDLVEAMAGQAGDLSLHDGSVVMVKEHRPSTIYVHGLVPKDGEFELPQDQPLRVTQAIALAGGRESEFADSVHVTRFVDGQPDPLVIAVSMKDAKSNSESNLVLLPGDIVSVEETPTTFAVDFLRNFFRVGLSIPGI